MSRNTLLLSCALSALAIGLPATALADTATDQATPRATEVETVVVEAERRAVSIEDVPVAISAYTSTQRDRLGILSIGDLTNFTPGFAYSSTTDRPSIRGISRLTNNFAVDNGVSTYSDGVWTNSTVAAASTPLMVQRTEILRGPQGTLYGRNSIGGAINVISRMPTHDWYAEIRGTAANYGYYNVSAAVSGPLTNWLRFRALGFYTNQDQGYFRNVADGSTEGGNGTVWYVEGQLEADLGPHADAWLKVGSLQYDLRGGAGAQLGPYDTAQFPTGSLGPGSGFGLTIPGHGQLGSVTTNPANTDIRTFNHNTPAIARLRDNLGIAGHFNWHADGFDIRYIGGWQRYAYRGLADFDNNPVTSYTYPGSTTTILPGAIFDYQENRTWWSNEVDFVSTGNGPVQWIAGAFQYREDYSQPFFIESGNPQLAHPFFSTFCSVDVAAPAGCVQGEPYPPFAAFGYHYNFTTPVAAAAEPDLAIYQTNTIGRATSYAGFAQVDWNITPEWRVTLGGRYTRDHKDLVESERLLCFGILAFGCPGILSNIGPGGVPIATDITAHSTAPAPGADPGVYDNATGQLRRRLHDSWSAWTGTAGVQWQPDPDTLAYFRFSRGYKAGGFNTGAASPISALPEVGAEHVNAYEVGFKRQIGSLLVLNISAFMYDYQGAQAPFGVVPPTGPAFTQFINIPRTRNSGVEIESTFSPIHNLGVIFNYARLNTHIVDGGGCFTDSLDPTSSLPSAHPCTTGGQRIEGRPLPATTPNKVAINVNYTWNFEPGDVTASVSWIWKDRTPYSFFGNPVTYAPAYDQTDARISFNSRDHHYTVIVYGRNLTDSLGYESAGGLRLTDGTVWRNFTLTPPRTYGVELQYRY